MIMPWPQSACMPMHGSCVKFIVGLLDVGEWLEEARVATAMLTCLADHMPGIIDHAWVHDRLLALVPSEFHARLRLTKSATRTPQTLFAMERQAFQDKHAELTITLAAPTYAASYKQPADRSFEQHLEACVKVYRSHYIRESLTPARYVERFWPTHRLGPLSTVCQTYVRTQLSHMSIDEASHAYLQGALEPIRTVCRMLDREEEERAHMAGVVAQAASLHVTPPADFGRGFDPYQGSGGRGGCGGRGGPFGQGDRCDRGGNDRTGNDHSSDLQVSISAAAATVSAHNAPGVNAIAAVHSHALCQGRSLAVNNRFTPLANHAQFLAANLAPVQIKPLSSHETTRNAVTFSDTATARSYAPGDRPRQVSTAPSCTARGNNCYPWACSTFGPSFRGQRIGDCMFQSCSKSC